MLVAQHSLGWDQSQPNRPHNCVLPVVVEAFEYWQRYESFRRNTRSDSLQGEHLDWPAFGPAAAIAVVAAAATVIFAAKTKSRWWLLLRQS